MTAREVELSGGAPWGFRMHGGADQNQPLRISRVNPGRKASLSGIREGDVISSINGRSTKGMSNADAHGMLRAAGPVLRLGLNEDREMSPRRRSIGKGSELKKPSQLVAESQKATPQSPVYATIRPANLPHHKPSSSSLQNSLNSIPAALNSTPLVKSVTTSEEPIRFHPTNPFYTTLPSNPTSASKLPVPNGRTSFSSVDRNKLKEPTYSDYNSDLRSPSYFTNIYDSGPSSLPYFHNDSENQNGYESCASKSTAKDTSCYFVYSQLENQDLPKETNSKNPFDTKRNSDPFEKYMRPENHVNGKGEYILQKDRKISSSMSDNNFTRKEITERSSITEHKISEVEEVKTIKKIILNGTGDGSSAQTDQNAKSISPPKGSKFDRFDFHSERNNFNEKRNDNLPGNVEQSETTTQRPQHYFSSLFDRKDGYFNSLSDTNRPPEKWANSPTEERKLLTQADYSAY